MNARVWLDRGTELFLSAVEQLSDAGLRQPSLLPGWTRAHVIAHVHYNAEALRRLVAWAATGREHRMYAGPHHRQTEIEHGATLHADALRALVRLSAADLRASLNALPDSAMDHPVITAQGRTVPAREIAWLRAREVAVHAVDLANGVTFDDLPHEFIAALVVEAAAKHAAAGQAADLAGWLTGRAADPPRLGSWL